MNSNLNEHEEKVKKPITVSWQDGDIVPGSTESISFIRSRGNSE